MQLNLDIKSFYNILKDITKFIPKKTTLSEYRCVYFNLNKSKLDLTVKNSSGLLSRTIEVESTKDSISFSFYPNDFLKILEKNKKEHILNLTIEDLKIEIQVNSRKNVKFNLNILDYKLEDELLKEEATCTISIAQLRKGLSIGILSGLQDSTSLIPLNFEEDKLSIFSLDDFRGTNTVIPLKGQKLLGLFFLGVSQASSLEYQLHQIMRDITSFESLSNPIGIFLKDNSLIFYNNFLFFKFNLSSEIDTGFLDLFKISNPPNFSADTSSTIEALNQISFLSSNGAVILEEQEDKMAFTVYSSEQGVGRSQIDYLKFKNLKEPIGVNCKHLLQALRTLPSNYHILVEETGLFIISEEMGMKIFHLLVTYTD